LFQDDADGNRTNVQQNALSGTLVDGDTIDITYNATVSQPTKFILVYQGTIGIDGGGNPFDPVDAGIGIAATTFTLDENGCTDCGCHTPPGWDGTGCPCGCD
jgi:hypothetical protein